MLTRVSRRRCEKHIWLRLIILSQLRRKRYAAESWYTMSVPLAPVALLIVPLYPFRSTLPVVGGV